MPEEPQYGKHYAWSRYEDGTDFRGGFTSREDALAAGRSQTNPEDTIYVGQEILASRDFLDLMCAAWDGDPITASFEVVQIRAYPPEEGSDS